MLDDISDEPIDLLRDDENSEEQDEPPGDLPESGSSLTAPKVSDMAGGATSQALSMELNKLNFKAKN